VAKAKWNHNEKQPYGALKPWACPEIATMGNGKTSQRIYPSPQAWGSKKRFDALTVGVSFHYGK